MVTLTITKKRISLSCRLAVPMKPATAQAQGDALHDGGPDLVIPNLTIQCSNCLKAEDGELK